MRNLILAGALLLPALWLQAQEPPAKKADPAPPAPPWAHVAVGGEIRDLLAMRTKVNVLALLDQDFPSTALAKQWHGPPPQDKAPAGTAHVRSIQVADAAWVVTLLDAADPNLDKVLPQLKAPAKGGLQVELHGIIAADKDKEPFVAHANAFGQFYIVNPKEKKKHLGMGEATVEGMVVRGRYELTKGTFTSLAIENGSSPILVTGPVTQLKTKIAGRCSMRGRLLVQKGGPLVINADTFAPAAR